MSRNKQKSIPASCKVSQRPANRGKTFDKSNQACLKKNKWGVISIKRPDWANKTGKIKFNMNKCGSKSDKGQAGNENLVGQLIKN